MHKLLSFPALVALSLTAPAQQDSKCAPVQVAPANGAFPDLGNLNLSTGNPSNQIQQIGQFGLIPARDATGAPKGPGLFTLYMTVQQNNTGQWDALMGEVDTNVSPWVFTATADAAAFNTGNDEFQFGITYDGLVGVIDQGTASGARPVVSVRSNPTVPFPAPTAITGPGAPNLLIDYVDSQVAIKGYDTSGNAQYEFIWINTGTKKIYAGDLNVTNGQVTNERIVVDELNQTQLSPGGWPTVNFLHSPTPLLDTNIGSPTEGAWQGLIGSTFAPGAGSDAMFYGGTRNFAHNQMHLLEDGGSVAQATNWYANPASVGGDHYYANAAAGYGDPLHLQTFSLAGGEIPQGGGNVTFLMSYPGSSAAAGHLLFINFGFQPPTPINLGALLNGGSICVLPVVGIGVGSANPTGTSTLTFTAPQLPLAGVPAIWAQAIMFDPAAGRGWVSNDHAAVQL